MARREALPATDRIAAAQAIAARGLPVRVSAGLVLSGYSPLKSEISPMPLLRRCADAGAALALPVVIGRGKPLVMRAPPSPRAPQPRASPPAPVTTGTAPPPAWATAGAVARPARVGAHKADARAAWHGADRAWTRRHGPIKNEISPCSRRTS